MRRKGLFRLRVLRRWLKKTGRKAAAAAENAEKVPAGAQSEAVESAENEMAQGTELAGDTLLALGRMPYVRWRAIQAKRAGVQQMEALAEKTAASPASACPPGKSPAPVRVCREKVLQKRAVSRYCQTRQPLYTSLPPGVKSVKSGQGQNAARQTEKQVAAALKKAGGICRRVLRAAAAALPAALTAGSAAIVLAAAVGTVAILLSGPFAILLADAAQDPAGIPVAEIVCGINRQMQNKIEDTIKAHPACDRVEYGNTYDWQQHWPEVLALFAVETSLSAGEDVLVLNDADRQRIETLFWEMHALCCRGEMQQAPGKALPEKTRPEEPGGTLYLWLETRTAEALAAAHGFTPGQREVLEQLLSPALRPELAALCSPSGFLWPLPGYRDISTRFGVSDAFGRPGHKGIDIPAPRGTPVLAAQDGTVVLASESPSYGRQVVLDHGGTAGTRYAHLSEIAVAAGQAVTRGTVIGYVGSTGMSTGSHLHFELRIDGVLIDPLEALVPG